ncbi:hypothetical protein OPW36_13965 [Vibrio europaeus]|uniref:Transmembrane protein n=1 Tax=Vibrio europaeus TaxID=300876 RepID=A0AAE7B0I6_9VIBR|nr:hypothetical protein [Vibrio europaeus]MDC5808109.1 hypothetical protein [Vibrio europaeus]MDC5825816.1 hypothetical protein [Vibrio europaeus]MDC5832805.1 hypothetical protein [Vibrio europaeus]MDC5837683.1 hypothetical protein [Vibrio europaeus]QJY39089.1 hypothetical protein HOO69_21350 [Vibrio europaeus]
MNSSLNIPTDNPYKLMAILGTVLFIFSVYLLVSQSTNSNEKILASLQVIANLKSDLSIPEPQKAQLIAIEERRVELAVEIKNFNPYGCAILSVAAIVLSGFGFTKWLKEIYPIEEAMRKEQLRSLELSNQKNQRFKLNKNSQ